MVISSYEKNGVAVVEIKGRLAAESVEDLRNAFLKLFADHRRFVFDLAGMVTWTARGWGQSYSA